MPLPRALARLNRVGLNRLIRYVVPWFPGFGLVLHVGRRSGRVYRTPVTLFVRNGRYVIALTYGAESDWVRNVLAAGGCRIRHGGREVRLTDPHVVHDPSRSAARPLERIFLRLFGVADFLVMERALEPGERRHIATGK
jgi:deazaflavin-dependent oxidoreductase (nitroreductase family)